MQRGGGFQQYKAQPTPVAHKSITYLLSLENKTRGEPSLRSLSSSALPVQDSKCNIPATDLDQPALQPRAEEKQFL